jgi:hypothetical protein
MLSYTFLIDMYTKRMKQNVAIAISTDVYEHIGGVGEVGGIIGKWLLMP